MPRTSFSGKTIRSRVVGASGRSAAAGESARTRWRGGRLTLGLVLLSACGEDSITGEPPPPPNRPPAATAIDAVTVAVGETVVVDASRHFNDPDGDALRYAASSSAPEVATASVAGSEVTVAGVSSGTAEVTVTARDPGGLTASQSFAVTVPNRPPAVADTMPDRTLFLGAADTLEASAFFADPDGYPLSYEAAVSDSAVASASVAGSTVTLTALAKGTAEVTVTARDPGGLTASQSFAVTVPNRMPAVADTMPDRTLFLGAADTLEASAFFADPDGDPLSYEAAVSDSAVASASVAGSTVTLTALAKGTAEVTVTARDPGGLTASQSFAVTVPNRPPAVADALPDRTLFLGEAETLEASAFFADPDGDPLSYEAAVSDGAVASASVAGSAVTLTALARGAAEVTVTARDPGGLAASQSFAVTVPNRPPAVADTLPDRTLFLGEADTLVLSRYFGDPDGDALEWGAETSDGAVARLAVAAGEGTLAVTAAGRGEARVTVTATDPEGLAASQSFLVTVPNRAPVLEEEIPAQYLFELEVTELDLGSHFGDPDGDPLAYVAETTDGGVARVGVDGAVLTIVAEAAGEATLTVAATDPGGLSASQGFEVTVLNPPPEATVPIPDQTVIRGRDVSLDASGHFQDPEGDVLRFDAVTANSAVATAETSGALVTIRGVETGETTLTVTATDSDGLSATQTARVSVGVSQRGPETVGSVGPRQLGGGEALTLEMASYFTHPDGEVLAYAAGTSNTGFVSVSMTGSTLRITAHRGGTSTITVVATDPYDRSATQRFGVTVTGGGGGGGFNIDIEYDASATDAVRSAIDGAAAHWEAILSAHDFGAVALPRDYTCSSSGITLTVPRGTTLDDILIVAGAAEIDGSGGVLARFGPCVARTANFPAIGMVVFDGDDLDDLQDNDLMTPVAIHEMAHVLGLGVRANWDALLGGFGGPNPDPHFAGTRAVAAFNAAGGSGYSGAKVPVDNAGGHWRESVLGPELLTPRVSSGETSPLSAITIQALADMGYTVDASLADAFTLPAGDAAHLAEPARTFELHDDIEYGPVMVIDRDGNFVRVIPGASQPPAGPRRKPAQARPRGGG